MGGKLESKNNNNEKTRKAMLKEKAILLIEKKGFDVENAFKKYGLKISPLSYPRIYKNYKEKGLNGLIDQRGGKRVEKITPALNEYIISKKNKDEKLTANQIREIVTERFDLKVHLNTISNILREAGLSNRKGRPQKKIKEVKEIAIDHAGGFLIKGALLLMGLVDVIVDRIERRTNEINKSKESDLNWMGILSASKKALSRKIESLIYMPIFQMERIWHFKTVYPRDGLGALCRTGLPYRYHTIDNFLRELSRLDIDKQLSRDLARTYLEIFHLNIETREEQTFYIDCHKKVLWTKKNVPKGLHATRNKILKCLDVYFIHDCNGIPILPWTRPGDSHLVNELLPIVQELEKAVGKDIVKLAIFDREGLSLALFSEITERGKRFITILKENQYNSEKDFVFEKGSVWESITIKTAKGRKRYKIKEATKVLSNKEIEEEYAVRAILAKDLTTGQMPVFITNITKTEEPDGKQIVKKYIKRWDQENSFKQMKPGLYLDTNHGSKAVALKENRVIKRKVDKFEEAISAKNNMIISAGSFIQKRLESIKKKKGIMEEKANQVKDKMNRIDAKILSEASADKKSNLLKKQREIYLEESKMIKHYESVLKKWESFIKQKERYINSKKDEIMELENKISKIDQKEILYEIDTQKDHIMTNLEVALNNADIFLKNNFFPSDYRNSDFRTSRDILYKQDGFIKESKDEILISLKHYQQEPEHQRLAEYVAEKFNAANIFMDDGKRLLMEVM